ncbi:MAG: hypothetical protein JJE25_03585, partial [Bacteroidia bacterium]|nr:hypothetical protein [Bacteroidia bacterium]
MKKIFTVIGFLFSICADAQITFQKTYELNANEFAMCVQQTSDGGYIMLGRTSISNNQDIYSVKTNSNGDTVWTKKYGGLWFDNGFYAHECFDGGYIIAGEHRITAASSTRIYIVKTNSIGDTLWTKSYYGVFESHAYCVEQTTDSGFVITGYTYDSGSYEDVVLLKIDSGGHFQWYKTYGGTNNDVGKSVIQSSDGGFVIAGYTASFGFATGAVYLIKTDITGNLIWSKTYSNLGGSANKVQQTTDGGYIVCGYDSNDQNLLIKTDAQGNLSWAKTYTGSGSKYHNSALQTTDGGYIIAGLNLIKTDNLGTMIWANRFNGSNGIINSVKQTADGGYIVSGFYYYLSNAKKFCLIKTNSTGQSGCNESIPTVFSSDAILQETIVSTAITALPNSEGYTSTIVGYGSIV